MGTLQIRVVEFHAGKISVVGLGGERQLRTSAIMFGSNPARISMCPS
jgi:hypothetical protein